MTIQLKKIFEDGGYNVHDLESRLEQVANLLALWKAQAKDSGWLDSPPGMHQRLVLCINKLESVLVGKPLPKRRLTGWSNFE